MGIIIICALTKNKVIGNCGKIPWHIKEDFEIFKKRTLNNVVIFGRKTFESLKSPLKNRINIIISSNLNFCLDKKYDNFEIVEEKDYDEFVFKIFKK